MRMSRAFKNLLNGFTDAVCLFFFVLKGQVLSSEVLKLGYYFVILGDEQELTFDSSLPVDKT